MLIFFKKQNACACMDNPPNDMINVRIGAIKISGKLQELRVIAPVVTSIIPQIIPAEIVLSIPIKDSRVVIGEKKLIDIKIFRNI